MIHGISTISRLYLFGFSLKLTAYLERSPLNHGYGHAFADDRPIYFASITLNSKPFTHYAG